MNAAANEQLESGDVASLVGDPTKERLDLQVEITNTGPCAKRIKIEIPKAEIDKQFKKQVADFHQKANLPGFRPGKAPIALIERRFRTEVSDQVKALLLAQSLEQITLEHRLETLSDPDIDFNNITFSPDQPFVFEFDVEVFPDFELPEYKGLKIKKPTRSITEAEVDSLVELYRRRFGTPQEREGKIQRGDLIVADLRARDESGKTLNEKNNLMVRVADELMLEDGRISHFAEVVTQLSVGEAGELTVTLLDDIPTEDYRGKSLKVDIVIQRAHAMLPAPLDESFFSKFGMADLGELRDFARARIERQLDSKAREEVTEQISNSLLQNAQIELPPKLLQRQSVSVMRNYVSRLANDGYDEETIRTIIGRNRLSLHSHTAQSLQKQFLFRRIAEVEQLKVEESDLEKEIQEIANSSGESVRKVRADIERDKLWEGLTQQILEKKTLNLLIQSADIEEVPMEAPTYFSLETTSAEWGILPQEEESLRVITPSVTEEGV